MSKYIPGDHKHLTAADRLYIESQLNAGSSFKDIARYLCKDPAPFQKRPFPSKFIITSHSTFLSPHTVVSSTLFPVIPTNHSKFFRDTLAKLNTAIHISFSAPE